MTLQRTTLGIDVSGAYLDGFLHPAGQARRLTNTPEGVEALIAWASSTRAFVVLEATAPWDQALVRGLEAAGLAFHRANPKRARDFARAAGLLRGRRPHAGALRREPGAPADRTGRPRSP